MRSSSSSSRPRTRDLQCWLLTDCGYVVLGCRPGRAARPLPQLRLADALEVLVLLARTNHPRFDQAASRWVGRLPVEDRIGLRDARFARAMVERLPQCRDALHRLTHHR